MINIILFQFLIITLFSNVHNEKIYYNLHKENTKKTLLFIKKNFECRKKYRLKAKKFINFRDIQIQRINDYRKRSGNDKNNINYNIRDAYNYHENL
ncbi:hypothetical protein PMLGA01_080014900, partial [Plasmodium malariae]